MHRITCLFVGSLDPFKTLSSTVILPPRILSKIAVDLVKVIVHVITVLKQSSSLTKYHKLY